jgi:hypothetical protein
VKVQELHQKPFTVHVKKVSVSQGETPYVSPLSPNTLPSPTLLPLNTNSNNAAISPVANTNRQLDGDRKQRLGLDFSAPHPSSITTVPIRAHRVRVRNGNGLENVEPRSIKSCMTLDVKFANLNNVNFSTMKDEDIVSLVGDISLSDVCVASSRLCFFVSFSLSPLVKGIV